MSKNEQGCYDLFDNPGVNAQSGEALTAVTKEIVRVVQKCGNPVERTQVIRGDAESIMGRSTSAPADESATARAGQAMTKFEPSTTQGYLGRKQTIKVSTNKEWSTGVRVEGDRCIWISDVSPDQVQAREEKNPNWEDWLTYQRLKSEGKVGNFGWVRVRSDGVATEVKYEFRQPGQCG